MKESIKQFFKPNWKKIIAFMIIAFLVFLCSPSLGGSVSLICGFLWLPLAIISLIFVSLISELYIGLLLFACIYVYILACLFVYVFDFLTASKAQSKRKEALFYIFFIIVCLVIFLMFASQSTNRKGNARDARRESDIRQMGTACEMYYDGENRFPAASDFADIKEVGIGEYMVKGSVPDDPGYGDVHYVWIDNTSEGQDQYFCVYAKSESSSKDIWFAASEKGVKEVTIEPSGLGDACWQTKTKRWFDFW